MISGITLSNLGDIATILLFFITIFSYFYVPNILKERKEIVFRIFLTLLTAALLYTFWKWGWLSWLFIKLQIPVWQIILLDIVIIIVVVFGFLIFKDSKPVSITSPEYFSLYGARWYIKGRVLNYPPVCEKCLMEMHSRDSAYRMHEIWECRECKHQISWPIDDGRLIDDVVVRFNALQRKEAENDNT